MNNIQNNYPIHALDTMLQTNINLLSENQDKILKLFDLKKRINTIVDKGGMNKVENDPESQRLLGEMGVKLSDKEGVFTNKEDVVENIRLFIEDLSIENEMKLQQVIRFSNERFEKL